MENKFRAIDLFSGAGGLSVGLEDAGFSVIAAVENNESAAKTYRLNHLKSRLYLEDIRGLSPEKVMEDLGLKEGDLDLLAGCPPCQGFSTHRTRNKGSSVVDERNDLIFRFVDYVKVMRPKTIMMENVPGLAKDGRMRSAVKDISNLGYLIHGKSVQVKDVSDYGVPQRRRRMILTASRFGEIPEPQAGAGKVTVRNAISHLPAAGYSGDKLHDWPSKRTPQVQKVISLIPKDGGSRKSLPKSYWLPCHLRCPSGYNDVYGRMRWDDVAPTITSGCHNPSKGRFLHPEEDRTITLREASLLQTFPNDYQFCLDRGKEGVALMIGNALPPAFIKIHAKEYYKHLTSLL